jgi:hypothetical protein
MTLLLTSFNGCGTSYWANRETNPSIQDRVYSSNILKSLSTSRSVNTFATTASRRVVIVSEDDTNSKHPVVTCSEPPPDVGEAFASAIADGFRIAESDPHSGVTGDLSNQYARAVATQIAPLVYRTQGLQIYRDGLHGLCIDKMNGWLDGAGAEATYLAQKQYLMNAAIELIKLELPIMEKAQEAFYQNVKAGIGMDSIQKIADVIKSSATTTTTSTATGTTTTSTGPVSP